MRTTDTIIMLNNERPIIYLNSMYEGIRFMGLAVKSFKSVEPSVSLVCNKIRIFF